MCVQWLSSTVGVVGVTVNVTFPLSGDESFLEPLHEALQRMGQGGVRLVVMSHVSSLPAVLLPVEKLVKLCRAYGVGEVLVDAAHALGSLPELNVTVSIHHHIHTKRRAPMHTHKKNTKHREHTQSI
jgi:selenocysteine lyase/cysteine desulfurase